MTPKQEAALRLAREALEEARLHIWLGDKKGVSANIKCHQTIAAIDEALAEQSHCDDCGGFDPECPLAQPAQQQQEPVARLSWHPGFGFILGMLDAGRKLPEGSYDLYTSPQPSKPWVGLNAEQRATIAEANNMLVDDDLFEAIEAKLRELNEHKEKNA